MIDWSYWDGLTSEWSAKGEDFWSSFLAWEQLMKDEFEDEDWWEAMGLVKRTKLYSVMADLREWAGRRTV